jgi:type I restriction enzyme S subunit
MQPRLRFKEFTSNWQEKKLGEISNFLDSTRKPIKESDRAKMKGDFPYYGASGIIDFVNDYIFDDEIILLGEDGENIVSRNLPLAFRVSGKCWVNNHAHVIKPFDNINIDFLTHSLERISYKEYNSGTAQPKLNQEVCKSIPLKIPLQNEQTKIASFLSAVDEKITQLTKKHELLSQYKKGVMQKIFSQELRFKADDGSDYPDWEEKKLEQVAFINMGQSPDSSSYNSEGNGAPLIQGNADIKNRVTTPRAWTSEPTKICSENDIILTVRAPVGAVAKSNIQACIGRGVCAITPMANTSKEYLYQLLVWYESFKWLSIEQGSTFTAVSGTDIKGIECPTPSLSEQYKIANFLSAIDDKIQNVQAQLDATKQYKQGLLQQMFV